MTATANWPARTSPFEGDVESWEMTCKVVGNGCELVATQSELPARPPDSDQREFRMNCEAQFINVFKCGHETSGIAVYRSGEPVPVEVSPDREVG